MTGIDHQVRSLIDAAIKQIASDNASGAAEILRHAGAVFGLLKAASAEIAVGNLERAQKAVIETGVAIALAQPAMSPLLKLASAVISAARIATSAAESLESAENAALDFVEKAKRGARDSASRAVTMISDGATVLTHSRSSTVLAAFVEARLGGKKFSVVATESRPMLEGRSLAGSLSDSDISVTLIADAAASLAMEQVDLILVGSDTITPANVVNKIGTRMIALAARERGLPMYAICDTSKFICEESVGLKSRHSGTESELWPETPSGVKVLNSYFEPTPLANFTAIITEDGALSIEEAARRAREASIDEELLKALEVLRDGVR
ncbi:MAG TPA: hypothetical protein VLR92_11250 [Blastocatellia bacterium]|nr:hypothetical protein [Blastocatellia bacterium]